MIPRPSSKRSFIFTLIHCFTLLISISQDMDFQEFSKSRKGIWFVFSRRRVMQFCPHMSTRPLLTNVQGMMIFTPMGGIPWQTDSIEWGSLFSPEIDLTHRQQVQCCTFLKYTGSDLIYSNGQCFGPIESCNFNQKVANSDDGLFLGCLI
jgi:hypothetical protein